MMLKNSLSRSVFLILLLTATKISVAQTTYSGTVLDEASDLPVPGAHVFVPGTTIGSVTDKNGQFVLLVTAPATNLSISSIGYRSELVSLLEAPDGIVVKLMRTYIDLSPVLVSASRELEPRSNVPASMSSLSAGQIEHARPSMLYQALNQVAGVHMVNLGNEQYKMSIRQPFTNKAYFLFMEDGIPLRPTGLFNPNALIDVNMAAIDRIEVLRGPGSAMYGSNAVAGAVNFITPSPVKNRRTEFSVRSDSYGYRRTDFSSGMKIGKMSLGLGGYGARQRDGYYEHSDFDKLSLTLRADYHFDDRTNLENAISISSLDTETNGALDSLNFFERGISSLQTFTYRRMKSTRVRSTLSRTWNDRQRSRLTAYYRNGSLSQIPYWKVRRNRSDRSRARGEVTDDSFRSLGLLAHHEAFLRSINGKLLVGASADWSPAVSEAEYIDVQRDADGRYTSFTRPDSMLSKYDVGIFNGALFTRIESQPLSGLKLIASLRYDRLRYDYDNSLDPLAYSGSPDGVSTFERLSPKAGFTFDLGRGRGLYANYSLGFAPPEVNELYTGVKVPNLKPATFKSYEVGTWAALAHGTVYLDVSLYAMKGVDEIIPVILNDGSRENRNAGRTRHRGVEYTLLYQPSRLLSIRLSGSNADHSFVRYNENGRDYSGNEMMNAPSWIANGEVTVRVPGITGLEISTEWQHMGGYELNNANTASYDGYDIFYVRGSYSRRNIRFWANLDNVLDRTFATTAAAYPWGTIYNSGQVRTLTLGAGYRF
jgi:iron complex outermembrane recepter protein